MELHTAHHIDALRVVVVRIILTVRTEIEEEDLKVLSESLRAIDLLPALLLKPS
jgi:hypothetical protein